MKSYFKWVLMVCSIVFLFGCSSLGPRYPYLNSDLTKETWQRSLSRSTVPWAQGAGSWFLSGGDNPSAVTTEAAPFSAVMSNMQVQVSNFSNIKIAGDFQVQLFGTYENNSVYVYGPNDAIRQVMVAVHGNTLYLNQMPKADYRVQKVIIRIGIKNLNFLEHFGNGRVEGIRLQSNGMMLNAAGRGNMYLAGNMNIRKIVHSGAGMASLFGVNSQELDIKAFGRGTLNISGNVGVRLIQETGGANINIVGANTNNLAIDARGVGRIGIVGIVNLCSLNAFNAAQVYIDGITSKSIYTNVLNSAIVGLKGRTQHLYVNTANTSCFLGRYLCAEEAFARARHRSHINVTAGRKIFASAIDNSSVYFFGSPTILSQFVNGNGTVIPIWKPGAINCSFANCVNPIGTVDYKNERGVRDPYSGRYYGPKPSSYRQRMLDRPNPYPSFSYVKEKRYPAFSFSRQPNAEINYAKQHNNQEVVYDRFPEYPPPTYARHPVREPNYPYQVSTFRKPPLYRSPAYLRRPPSVYRSKPIVLKYNPAEDRATSYKPSPQPVFKRVRAEIYPRKTVVKPNMFTPTPVYRSVRPMFKPIVKPYQPSTYTNQYYPGKPPAGSKFRQRGPLYRPAGPGHHSVVPYQPFTYSKMLPSGTKAIRRSRSNYLPPTEPSYGSAPIVRSIHPRKRPIYRVINPPVQPIVKTYSTSGYGYASDEYPGQPPSGSKRRNRGPLYRPAGPGRAPVVDHQPFTYSKMLPSGTKAIRRSKRNYVSDSD